MNIRIQYIHKIAPRPDLDTKIVGGNVTDLIDLDSVRRMLRRHDQIVPNSAHDRQETDNDGKPRFVLFPQDSSWHSIIVSEEKPGAGGSTGGVNARK